MLFNSLSFPAFFLVYFSVFFALPSALRKPWLLVGSGWFYAVAAPQYLWLLGVLVLSDFLLARYIASQPHGRSREWAFGVAVGLNLAALVLFKFLHEEEGLFLPPGISFHTFQSIAYLVEVHQGRYAPETSIGRYTSYIFFWPQLVAGPIERPQGLLKQLKSWPKQLRPFQVHIPDMVAGFRLILFGAFKKMVIGDHLVEIPNVLFNNLYTAQGLPIWIGAFAYIVHLYCDFSGYTDIARGCARWMGIELTENFRRPFLARSPPEFWSRWHISLTTWFRDYLYLPLKPHCRTAFSKRALLVFVWILIGFWHGMRPPMLVWGVYTALTVMSAHVYDWKRLGVFGCLFNLILFALGAGFFRAQDLNQSRHFFTHLFGTYSDTLGFFGGGAWFLPACGLGVVFLIFTDLLQEYRPGFFDRLPWVLRMIVYNVALVLILLLGVFNEKQFAYYQF